MRFKLAYKIFATLTLTSLLVVTLMVGLIKFYVARNFADYVNRSLLERYSQVADALAVEYKTRRSWQEIKDYPGRWQEILRTGLLQKDFDPDNGPPQPPDSENKGFSGRTQARPSAEPSRRIQRLARRLALFDTDRHHIAGGRSRVAHELRTPLSILRGEIEALKDGVREVNRDTLNSLLAEARHLTKIVNDLHELSLADTGALSVKKTPVDPAAILKETLGHFKQDFANRQIAIENNLENQPPIHIIGDADRLQQLFSNLVENTLRYADAPGILKIGQECTANRSILFFEDSGPGVPQGALDHLFDRLYRVARARSRAQGGSGLGLSICKSIVNALGGEIRATNGNLGGLRIEVELPHTG